MSQQKEGPTFLHQDPSSPGRKGLASVSEGSTPPPDPDIHVHRSSDGGEQYVRGGRSLFSFRSRQRPQPLVTRPACCGLLRMYRPRTTFAALLMLALGMLFLVLGLSSMLSAHVQTGGRGGALILLGSLMFLPGSYATYILLGIHMRWNNFDGTMLPSYDDDESEDTSLV